MSIRQRLYPGPEHEGIVLRHCGDARFVCNLGLEQRNLWRKDRTAKINYLTQARELAELRGAFSWLKEGSSSVQQQALRDLDKAFKNWWNNAAHFSRPTWRKAGQKGRILRTRPLSWETQSQVGRGSGTKSRMDQIQAHKTLARFANIHFCE